MTDVLQYGYAFPEEEAEKIAADAEELAEWQQGTTGRQLGPVGISATETTGEPS